MDRGESTQIFGADVDLERIVISGELSDKTEKALKLHGVYRQRPKDMYVVRVVLPLGVITGDAAEKLADVAGGYGEGTIHLTTRQNLQLYDVSLNQVSFVIRALHSAGLSTFHGSGDVVRNIVSCPGGQYCPHRQFDVSDAVRRAGEVLAADRGLDRLPRKLKIAFSGCEGACNLPQINDIGAIAIRGIFGSNRADGFRVIIGGGHGRHPVFGVPLFEFVPLNKIVEVCCAIAVFFRDHGERQDRASARLKYLIAKLGISRSRALIENTLDDMGISRDDVLPKAHTEPRSKGCFPAGSTGCSGETGAYVQRIRVPKGMITENVFRRLAELSKKHGDGFLRATPRQNLEMHGVRADRLAALRKEIEHLGLGTNGFFGLSDVVVCPGRRYCRMGATSTHDMTDILLRLFEDHEYDDIRDRVTVNVTGCANACAPFRTANIGLRGARIRGTDGMTDGFEISLGGSADRFGEPIGRCSRKDCERIIPVLLNTFQRIQLPDERFSDTLHRTGRAPFIAAVTSLHPDSGGVSDAVENARAF